MNPLKQLVSKNAKRIALPLAVYPGIHITGTTVSEIVNNPEVQVAVLSAINKRYETPIMFTAMDLSVEAEAFGCPLFISENEVPTVHEPIITSPTDVKKIRIPDVGEKRTSVYLATVKLFRKMNTHALIFGGAIGPFSLACRLAGMNEILCYTMDSEKVVHEILKKCSIFLRNYITEFKKIGASGVIMAEPAAGLLSPQGMSQFSSAYIRQIIEGVQGDDFSVILHNCSAKNIHFKTKLEARTDGLHFGAPMNIVEILKNAPSDKIIFGNLDPTAVFLKSTSMEIYQKTLDLLEKTHQFSDYIISSGCDVPAGTSIENLDAFFQACSDYNQKTIESSTIENRR